MGSAFSFSCSSRPGRPLPSSGRDRAISWPLGRAAGAPVWPQPDKEEKEGPIVSTEEEENKPDVGVERCQWREVQAPELHQWEQAAHRELDVLAQWRQKATVQELSQGKKVASDPKLPQESQAHFPASSEEMPSAGAQSPGPALRSCSCPPRISLSPLRILAEARSEETSVWSDEDWECHIQTELSQGEASSGCDVLSELLSELSDREDCLEPELCRAEVISCDSTSQELHVSSEKDSSHDFTDVTSDSELSISSFGPTPLLREEDDCDQLSILELHEEGGRAQSVAVPLPGEAQEAVESIHASLPSLQGQGSVAQQGPKAGPAAPSKRRGRLRRAVRALRALRGLCRCPCLRAQTQE